MIFLNFHNETRFGARRARKCARAKTFFGNRTTKNALKLSLQKLQGEGKKGGFPPLRFSMFQPSWEESSKYLHIQFEGRGFGSDIQIRFWPLFVTKNGILTHFLTFLHETVREEVILECIVSLVCEIQKWGWILQIVVVERIPGCFFTSFWDLIVT